MDGHHRLAIEIARGESEVEVVVERLRSSTRFRICCARCPGSTARSVSTSRSPWGVEPSAPLRTNHP